MNRRTCQVHHMEKEESPKKNLLFRIDCARAENNFAKKRKISPRTRRRLQSNQSMEIRGYELCKCTLCFYLMWSMPVGRYPSGEPCLDNRTCDTCSGADKRRSLWTDCHRREKVLDDTDADFDMFDKTTYIRDHLLAG